MVFQSTIYSVVFYNYKVTMPVCVGLLLRLGLGISVCGGFILGIRKLKLKNPPYKDIENRILDIQSHQMSSSSSSIAKTMYSNPIVSFIAGFAGTCSSSGSGTQYQQFQDTEMEGEEFKRESREAKPRSKPATAEAGSQVCQEIIGKRERRNKCDKTACVLAEKVMGHRGKVLYMRYLMYRIRLQTTKERASRIQGYQRSTRVLYVWKIYVLEIQI